ncbi:hypothetical protein AALB52_12890 [Lachnospiraceae bacterium 38-14]|jgi:X-X-X-Leu-X-X-Gly heptad repeats/X-X-X-Leu-X-X-Gly heptad repeats/X-X-X-Leu-X-X-Gly heptad repeats
MKLAELKSKFKNKYVIRIVAGVLTVAVLGSSATAYTVYGAKKTAVDTAEDSKGQDNSEFENDLKDMLSDNINVEAKEVDKDETVYVIADSTGKATSTIVSAWLRNPDGKEKLTDASDLKDITNVKGDETFTQKGSEITWDAAGSDIYYQGTTSKDTPVTEKITYFLDGKEVSPKEIAGKSGKVKIRFDYTNNEKTKASIAGKEEEINVPFIVVSGMVLGDNFTNVDVTNGKVISNGAGNMVVGIAMPGLKDSLNIKEEDLSDNISIPDYVEVTADAEDFELDMTMSIVSSSSSLNVDGAFDFSDLDSKIDDLSDAVDKLSDGSGDLADGLKKLNEKMPEFSNGLNDLQNGVRSYTDGAKTLADGISTLKSSSGELISGVDQLKTSVNTLNNGVQTLNKAVSAKMSDKEKEAARAQASQAAQAAVDAQLADGSEQFNGIKAQAAEQFRGTILASKDAVTAQAREGANQVVAGKMDAIKGQVYGQVDAMAPQITEQLAGSITGSLGGIKDEIKAGLVQAGIPDAQAEQIAPSLADGINAKIAAKVPELSGAVTESLKGVAGQTADAVASGVASEVAGAVAGTVLDGVAGQADTIGNSVASAARTAAKQAAGTASGEAAIQGAETAKATIASNINAKDKNSGHSLVSGMNELNKAVKQMAQKMPTLSSGIDQLYNGSQTLVSNNGTINDGLSRLVDGKNTMAEGVTKLASGSRELADGVIEFNEEGIEKLLDSYNGDVKELVDRIQAIMDAGCEYESFGGKAEDTVSSVKFIIKTDAIKADKE